MTETGDAAFGQLKNQQNIVLMVETILSTAWHTGL